MKYSEALAEIQATTKRPDKLNTAKRELNAAISFYCLDNEFSRDLAERNLVIDAYQYTQSVNLSEFARFRKFKYIKYGGGINRLTPLADAELFKPCLMQDKFYISGDVVNVNLAQLIPSLDVGWYQFPPILTGKTSEDTFWLLDVAPYMVIDRALAVIFRDIGDEKSMQTYQQSAREAYLNARKDLGISTQ